MGDFRQFLIYVQTFIATEVLAPEMMQNGYRRE